MSTVADESFVCPIDRKLRIQDLQRLLKASLRVRLTVEVPVHRSQIPPDSEALRIDRGSPLPKRRRFHFATLISEELGQVSEGANRVWINGERLSQHLFRSLRFVQNSIESAEIAVGRKIVRSQIYYVLELLSRLPVIGLVIVQQTQ